MATEEKSRPEEPRRRRRVEARPEEPRRRRRVESRRRVTRGIGTGTTPRVWRPGRFPRQNLAPAGPKHPCGELPNGLKPRRVENYRVGFQPWENSGTPAGKAASKVGLKSIFRTKSAQEPIFRKCLDLNDCLDSTNKSVQKSHTKNNYARVLAECKMQPNTRGRGYQCVC